jgi:peroxiredoxin
MTSRLLFAALAAAGAAVAADSAVSQAASRLEQKAAQAPKAVAVEVRLRAAQVLQPRYPELARKLLNATLEELRGSRDWEPGLAVLQSLAEISPSDAVALVPNLRQGASQTMITALVYANHSDQAVALYKQTAASLPDPLSPADAWWLITASSPLAKALPDAVAESYERVIRAASAPDYGRDAKNPMTGTIQMGSTSIKTGSYRETLLILAGARLRVLAPERFEKFSETFARWNITGPAVYRGNGTPAPPEVAAISKRMGTMRGLPTDADRTQLVKELVPQIRALPGPQKLGMIQSLANVATEGDLGKEALGAVAATLAGALRESNPSSPLGDGYLELAKLVRYEHLAAPPDPSLDAAQALLELRERVQQENGFTLTSLDGKTYTLAALKGRIVLLNFWATWCPPCRKEMPDMERLYRTYESKGLTVIAVSDEDRATVAGFLAKNNYTFPIALDPGRTVNTAFTVEGIPKSFIFDREGRLAAQSIDMRTEKQFLELLKMAGLEE